MSPTIRDTQIEEERLQNAFELIRHVQNLGICRSTTLCQMNVCCTVYTLLKQYQDERMSFLYPTSVSHESIKRT